jgi:hypothetical protein
MLGQFELSVSTPWATHRTLMLRANGANGGPVRRGLKGDPRNVGGLSLPLTPAPADRRRELVARPVLTK